MKRHPKGRQPRRRDTTIPRPTTVQLCAEPCESYDPRERPTCRAQCAHGMRPCPWISCRWNLYLDDVRKPRPGKVRYTWPSREPWEVPASCALDVADEGGATLEEVGQILNVSRERIRQIEARALRKIERALRRYR